jgi:hypothetical protein
MGLLASFICYARTHFFTVFLGDFNVRFFDTDDYMTIVRIRDFFDHYDLSNSIIARANVPFGGDMHWTRIYDFFLIIPAYILKLFLGSVDKATEYVGLLISPLVKCTTTVALLSLFRKIMTRSAALWATLIFMIHPALNYINMFGRPDHHAFIMLLLIIYVNNMAELCQSGFTDCRIARNAGIISALCVWTSPETLMFLLSAEAAIFFCYHNDSEKLEILYQKNIISTCAIGVIVFLFCRFDIVDILCIGALLIISYFTIKRYRFWHIIAIIFMAAAFSTLPLVEYDKISVVHLILYMCFSVFLGWVRIYHKRLLFSIIAGCIVGLMFLYMFPKFLYGMEADVSELLKLIWLSSEVDELKSPFHFGKIPSLFFSIYMMISSIAIYNKIHDLMSKKFENMDAIWWVFVVTCACYQLFASMADRMRPMYVCLGIPLIVDLAMNGIPLKPLPSYLKITVACILSLSVDTIQKYYYILPYYLLDPSGIQDFCTTRKNDYYQEDRFFKFLDSISEKPQVILTYLGKSAKTLYYTKHKVVAAPYHRQEQGILAFFSVLEKDYDEDEVKKILLQTATSYIFISKTLSYSNPKTQNSLAGMIIRGTYPSWISIVDIPSEFEDVILVKIDQGKLRAHV